MFNKIRKIIFKIIFKYVYEERKGSFMDSKSTIFLFGAAEKGSLRIPIYLDCLEALLDIYGQSLESCDGLYYAIQILLFNKNLIYYRVEEEGESIDDYRLGISLLKRKSFTQNLTAICMPSVSDSDLIQDILSVCYMHQSLLIINEKDLYDYLTIH